VLFNRAHPEQPTMTWNQTDRRDAYCIDRYEYPNKAGELPKAGVTWLEAKKLCENSNKVLCSVKQWKESCQAKEFVVRFTFGKRDAQGDECNWNSGAAKPVGSMPICHNGIGAFDMNGNVAEWTMDGGQVVGESGTMGGGFNVDPNNGNCLNAVASPQTTSAPHLGFRCCRPLGNN
jgi:formylglycine-generating enzyme required for sulfatase activity